MIRALICTVVETCVMSKEGKVHERVSQAVRKGRSLYSLIEKTKLVRKSFDHTFHETNLFCYVS